MLHFTGEAKAQRGVGRREIGHETRRLQNFNRDPEADGARLRRN